MSVKMVKGIQFFDSSKSCIDWYETSPRIYKILQSLRSFGTLFTYLLGKITLIWQRAEDQIALSTQIPPGGFFKPRLVVCLHGLNSNPVQFKKIFDELHKRDLSTTDVYIPYILQKGNAKLDEMVKPIFEEIVRYASNGHRKELVLVGISNGGRIARGIEAALIKSIAEINLAKLHRISIAGACKGSSLVNLLHRFHLSWFLSRNIAEEMATNSKRNQRLNQDLEGPPSLPFSRTYSCIASPHDWQVPNYESTLAETVGHSGLYAIVPGHGHSSIVNAAASAVVELIFSQQDAIE